MSVAVVVGLFAATSGDPLTADRVVALADAARRSWQVPGVAVAVVRGADTVGVAGFGVRAAGRPEPVTADTLFPLASCTKGFTAAVLATLVDDGKLGWDDPVRTHLPDFRLADPASDGLVTLRDLLSHRTGVGGHDLLWYRAPWTLDETLRRAARLAPEGPFRGSYFYNSTNVIAAGRAAAAVGGKPWDRLVRERLTGPLGMADVAFTTAEAERFADRALPHDRAGRVTDTHPFAEPNPAGSLHATARGLTAWLKFHLADGQANGRQLVSAKQLRETRRPHTPMPLDDPGIGPTYPDAVQASYGLGWVLFDRRGSPVLAHGGQIDGFRAVLLLLPWQRVGVAVLANLDKSLMPVALAYTLADVALGGADRDWDAHFQKVEAERDAVPPLPAGATPTLPLDRYAGTYSDPAFGEATVAVEGAGLVFSWAAFRTRLESAGGHTFRMTDGHLAGRPVAFVGRDGRVTGVRALERVFTR